MVLIYYFFCFVGLWEFGITAAEGRAAKDTNDVCFGKTADVLHSTILVTIDAYNKCKT